MAAPCVRLMTVNNVDAVIIVEQDQQTLYITIQGSPPAKKEWPHATVLGGRIQV